MYTLDPFLKKPFFKSRMKKILRSAIPACLWNDLCKWTAIPDLSGRKWSRSYPNLHLSRHLYFRIIINELAICILLIISLIKDKSLSPILRCNYNIPLISTKSINRILVLILDRWDQNQNQRLNEVKNLSVARYNTN